MSQSKHFLVQLFMRCLLGISVFLSASGFAQTIEPQDIPENLRAWQPWVLFDHKTSTCPFLYNQFDMRLCAWPTQLALNVGPKQLSFVQQWQVFNRSWILLPGEATQWPQNVRVNGEPYPVLPHQDRPAVELLAGNYTIEGEIFFDKKPAYLRIPQNTGWVNLVVNGQKNATPQWDVEGRLWLTAQGETQAHQPTAASSETTIRVFRKMIQSVPFEILTVIELDVGTETELQLGPVNIVGTEPLRIDSPLPTQLDQRGFLRVQARPGQWQVSILSRTLTPPTALKRPPTTEGAWPAEEIWTLTSDPRFGLMTIDGVPRVDPTQTNLPESWRKLLAYRVLPQDTVTVKQSKTTAMPNNQLRLNREMWLDFNGQNYTVKDVITGEMLSQWRLSLLSPFTLGHVSVNGVSQLITVEEDKQGQPVRGVEVRSGQLLLEAMSQVGQHLVLPVTGWNQDFDRARIRLHLPPGWQLLTAIGVDKISLSWLSNFTLFDIFMIAVMSTILGVLLGKRWGLLAVVMFLLIYPLPYAPRWLWLNIAIILILLPWFPKVLQKGGRFYRDLSMIALTLCAGIFCLMALRVAIFPQLNPEPPHILTQLWQKVAPHMPFKTQGIAMYKAAGAKSAKSIFPSENAEQLMEGAPPTRVEKTKPTPEIMTPVDAKTQTGPAIPTWEGTVVNLSWAGSVSSQQSMRLILISPMATRLLAVLQVVLTLLLCVRLWQTREDNNTTLQTLFKNNPPKMMVWLMACLLSAMVVPLKTHANDYPPTDILQTLEQRLLVPPTCLPHCASLASAQLTTAQDNTFKLELQMETTEAVAVPIPRGNNGWQVMQILLDGQAAPGVASEPAQLLLQLPPGVHRVAIVGQILTPQQVNIDFPLKPYQIQLNVPGWQIEGMNGQQLQGSGIVLKRSDEIVQSEPTARVTSEIQPFVQVTRHLTLGLTGAVETQVQRLTPLGDAIHIAIPLLPHESVITPDMAVQNGRLQVNLAPTQMETTWQSTLTHFTDVTLLAPKTTEWVEIWQLNIDPVWHAMITGIAPLAETSYQTWEPIWRPWPGESIHVQLMRLPAAPGTTMTIDNAELMNYISDRNTDSILTLSLRSTLGGQQRITLPNDAKLQMLSVNGMQQVPMIEKNIVTLTLVPGDNNVRLRFETPQGTDLWVKGSRLGLDSPLANITQGITLPTDRWVWILGGAGVGPGMVFWGMALLLVLTSIILAQTQWVPLKTWQLLLLGLGILMISPWVALLWLIVAILLGWRSRQMIANASLWMFRAQQVGWILLMAVALLGAALAIQKTLAGTPLPWAIRSDLPQSTLADWVWFQDMANTWPRVWVISTPLWVYRLTILIWSLGWVLFLLRAWPWAWKVLTAQGVWTLQRVRSGN